LRETKENIIEEWSRRSTILPEFIGKKFAIHNGKGFFSKTIKENMIGHLFGEFSFTKTRAIYKSKRNKKKKSMSKSKS
jgi:small subunit ribosomal protein S19